MTETVFKTVDYQLSGLIQNISVGTIGLPDLQRPFVWKNAKVRELFDSMYKGTPWDSSSFGKMARTLEPALSAWVRSKRCPIYSSWTANNASPLSTQ